MAKYHITDPNPTPPPKTSIEMAAVVARIDDRTRAMREIDLPRIERIASSAKDGVNLLTSRVSVLENNPHECDEKDRQAIQDEDIAENKEIVIEHKEKIKSLYKLKGWFFGIVGSIATAAIVFALTTQSTEATNTTNIDNNRKVLDRHEVIIQDLPRKQDLEAIRQAVNLVPTRVRTSIEEGNGPPTAEEVSTAAEELPLKSYELKQLKIILARAKSREDLTKTNQKQGTNKLVPATSPDID